MSGLLLRSRRERLARLSGHPKNSPAVNRRAGWQIRKPRFKGKTCGVADPTRQIHRLTGLHLPLALPERANQL